MNTISLSGPALHLEASRPASNILGISAGLLLYLSTTYIFSNILILAVLAILSITRRYKIVGRHLLVGLFSTFAILNIILHLGNFSFDLHSSSLAVILVFFVAILAPNLPSSAVKTFMICTAFEVLVGIYQIMNGQVALTEYQASLAFQNLRYDSVLLYDIRVFGLSANSSLFAEKIFVAAIFGYFTQFSIKLTYIFNFLIIIGLIITFNRTALLTTVILYLMVAAQNYKFFGKSLSAAVAAITVIVGASAFVFLNFDEILNQLFRGNLGTLSDSELTRLEFWNYALGTLADNPFAGNGSLSFRIMDDYGVLQHAHNSFLMILATHGILIPLFLFAYIALSLNRANAIPLIAVIIFSLSQYFIFWNLSVPDVLLFWLLGKSYVDPV